MKNYEDLEALLVDCDDVALQRGDPYGLCDAIDNTGMPYKSATLDIIIRQARESTEAHPQLEALLAEAKGIAHES